MQKLNSIVAGVLVLMAISATGALAKPQSGPPGPPGTFSSAFTIQNLGASMATCIFQFYDAAGAVAYTSSSFTIAVNSSSFTYVPSLSGLAAGQYSGVVSCDQQVAAVVNQSTPTGAGSSAASYIGVDGTKVGTSWNLPTVYNNYFNYYTNFVVQNATGSPVNVTVKIYASGGGAPVATQTANNVPAFSFTNFNQDGLGGLAANTPYSAIITGTGNLAVEANIFGKAAVAGQLYSYDPFSSGSTSAFTPVIMRNYFGYNTALTVQNIGTVATDVTVTYGTGGISTTLGVAAGSSVLYYTPNSSVPIGSLTSAKITSSGQPIVAVVNESTVSTNRAASYAGFASGTTTVRAPIVLKRYFGYNSSITCQNVGASSTNMTIAYSGVGPTTTASGVAVNQTALFYQPGAAQLSNGYLGSATITSSGQPIVCVVNEDENEAPNLSIVMDQLYAYEGINQ
jgi:hypothetical protein